MNEATTAINLANATYQVLQAYDSIDTVKAVLVDNTPPNVGYKGGQVFLLCKLIQRRLHLIGCSLHMNELSLRAIFKILDGMSKSSTTFEGPIG